MKMINWKCPVCEERITNFPVIGKNTTIDDDITILLLIINHLSEHLIDVIEIVDEYD